MDLRKEALREHSKSHSLRIVDHILKYTDRMQDLMSLFFNDTYRVTQRLAWVVGILADKNPELIEPYLPAMVALLGDKSKHDAIRRNIVRTLQNIDIPEELESDAYNYCMESLIDHNEAIAIRCFSMSVLYNIALNHPDLKSELKEVLLLHDEVESAGFKSRSKRVLRLIAQNSAKKDRHKS